MRAFTTDALQAGSAPDRPLFEDLLTNRLTASFPIGQPPRIGVLEEYFLSHAEASVETAFQDALSRFEKFGAPVQTLEPPMPISEILDNHRTIMAAEAAAVHSPRFRETPDEYPPRLQELIRHGLSLPAAAYILAKQHQRRTRDRLTRLFEDVDLLACPATPGPAPDRSSTGDPRFNSPWSYVGFPTVSFPIAFAPSRLPLGVQIVGPFGADSRLLRHAAWCEKAVGFETPSPQGDRPGGQ